MQHRFTLSVVGLNAVLLAGSLTAQQAAASSSSEAARSKLDRVIDAPLAITFPASSCIVPLMTRLIAAAIEMPAGIESLPEPCRTSESTGQPNARQRLTLTGMTGREALARLLELDPRYTALETSGVLVVRPVAASNDARHFLHRAVGESHVDAANFSVALQRVFALWSPMHAADDDIGHPGFTPQGQKAIAFDINASAYETLNEIARTHGALLWRISYCPAVEPTRPASARPEIASLIFETFDGSGSGAGWGTPIPRDANWREIQKCTEPSPGGLNAVRQQY